MRVILAGGTWTRVRIEEAGLPQDSFACKRCTLGVPETDFHRNWECPGNCSLPDCEATKDLEQAVARHHLDTPCFWLRGIVPASWTKVAPPDEQGWEETASFWEQAGTITCWACMDRPAYARAGGCYKCVAYRPKNFVEQVIQG